MIHDIAEHFEKEYPREGCGIIAIVQGKKHWFPCTNVALDGDFAIDPNEYFEIRKRYDIYAIVHSHPDGTCKPSENDIKYCNAMGVRYWIFSYPGMDLEIVEPKEYYNELLGKEYEFGVYDCLEAVRAHYKKYLGIELQKRLPYLDDWWKHGHDYFTEEHIAEWGFHKVEELKSHDILVFKMGADVSNHCGVYIGNSIFYHHAVNRLSCKENLYPLWKKYLVGIYRYGT